MLYTLTLEYSPKAPWNTATFNQTAETVMTVPNRVSVEEYASVVVPGWTWATAGRGNVRCCSPAVESLKELTEQAVAQIELITKNNLPVFCGNNARSSLLIDSLTEHQARLFALGLAQLTPMLLGVDAFQPQKSIVRELSTCKTPVERMPSLIVNVVSNDGVGHLLVLNRSGGGSVSSEDGELVEAIDGETREPAETTTRADEEPNYMVTVAGYPATMFGSEISGWLTVIKELLEICSSADLPVSPEEANHAKTNNESAAKTATLINSNKATFDELIRLRLPNTVMYKVIKPLLFSSEARSARRSRGRVSTVHIPTAHLGDMAGVESSIVGNIAGYIRQASNGLCTDAGSHHYDVVHAKESLTDANDEVLEAELVAWVMRVYNINAVRNNQLSHLMERIGGDSNSVNDADIAHMLRMFNTQKVPRQLKPMPNMVSCVSKLLDGESAAAKFLRQHQALHQAFAPERAIR